MSYPIVITGAASGIGAASAALLRSRGEAVIGVDLNGCEVSADLSTEAGQVEMAAAVEALAPDGIRAVIACAGTANIQRPDLVVRLNHFGAVATLVNLRPLLERTGRGRGVLVGSSAALLDVDEETVEACLADNEQRAVAAAEAEPMKSYSSSKKAVSLWMRQTAVKLEWAGRGIALNAVAPGTVRTPMTAPILATEEGRAMLKLSTPIATPDYGEPTDIAELLAFLAMLETAYVTGNIIFADGGTNVMLRPNTI